MKTLKSFTAQSQDVSCNFFYLWAQPKRIPNWLAVATPGKQRSSAQCQPKNSSTMSLCAADHCRGSIDIRIVSRDCDVIRVLPIRVCCCGVLAIRVCWVVSKLRICRPPPLSEVAILT